MLEKEAANLDAVVIATPDWIHHEQTIQCLRAGLHVYCETPMSNRIESAREMVKVARETGRMLEIGYQRRSHPRYLALRDVIVAKHQGLGNLSHAYAQWHIGVQFSAPLQTRESIRRSALARQHGYASVFEMRNWRLFRRYGLGAMGMGVPLVDIFNYVFQSVPRRISALGGVHYWMSENPRGRYETPDKVLANFEYDLPPHLSPDGKARTVTASLQLLTTTNWQDSFECFHGDAASVEISEYYPRNKIQLTYNLRVFSQDEEHLRRLEESGDHVWADRVRNNIHFAKAWKKMLEQGLIYEAENDRIWRARRPWESPKPWGKPPPRYTKTPYEEDEEQRGLNFFYPRLDIDMGGGSMRDFSDFRLAARLGVPSHQPHLLNFFAAVQTGDPSRLRCPGEEGFRSCVTALKTLEAVETGQTIELSPEDYEV